jgi:hypothetical protein
MLALDFGCAVHEDIWTVDEDAIRVRNCPGRLPLTYYRWHTDPDGETLVALEQYGYRRHEFKNVTLPAEKMCRYTYQQEAANFWGIPLLRAMYPSWYIKQSLIRIDAVACERNGMGVPAYKLPVGFSKEDWESAFNFVTQLCAHEATGIVEPPGDPQTGFRLVGTMGSVRQIMPSINRCNLEMAACALEMSMMSGQTPYGHRATAQVHHDSFMLSLQALADELMWALQTTTIRRLVQYNFGLDAPVPDVVIANLESRQLSDMIDGLTKMAQSGILISEDNVRRFIREEWGLPEESDQGIVALRGMTITPETEADTGVVAGGTKQGQIEGEPGGVPKQDSFQPQKQAAGERYVRLRLDLPDKLAQIGPGFRFYTANDMQALDERPHGPHLVLRNEAKAGTYTVKTREGDAIEVAVD